MIIREITLEDYDMLVPFWKEHYFVSEMDEKPRFRLFLEKNPGLSLVAIGEQNEILGTLLGSFDGRRGYIQKLVVGQNARKQGTGRQLLKKIFDKFRSLDVLYVPIACEEKNVPFYEKCGFKKTGQTSMSISHPRV